MLFVSQGVLNPNPSLKFYLATFPLVLPTTITSYHLYLKTPSILPSFPSSTKLPSPSLIFPIQTLIICATIYDT